MPTTKIPPVVTNLLAAVRKAGTRPTARAVGLHFSTLHTWYAHPEHVQLADAARLARAVGLQLVLEKDDRQT